MRTSFYKRSAAVAEVRNGDGKFKKVRAAAPERL